MLEALLNDIRDHNLSLSDLRTKIMRLDEEMQDQGCSFFSEAFQNELKALDEVYQKAEILGARFFNKYYKLISKEE